MGEKSPAFYMNKYVEKIAATYDSKSGTLIPDKPMVDFMRIKEVRSPRVLSAKQKAVYAGGALAASALAGLAFEKYRHQKAAGLSDENKQVLRTAGEATVVGLPAGIAGAKIGHMAGSRLGRPSVGTFLGSHIIGGVAELAALKHGFRTHANTLRNKEK